jgi:hypothetical protein
MKAIFTVCPDWAQTKLAASASGDNNAMRIDNELMTVSLKDE